MASQDFKWVSAAGSRGGGAGRAAQVQVLLLAVLLYSAISYGYLLWIMPSTEVSYGQRWYLQSAISYGETPHDSR
eukprot:3939496-Rhodomonas_salina.1